GTFLQLEDVQRADAGLQVVGLVGGDDADEHQQRASERVQEELDRRVNAVRAAPNTDEQRHRDEHDLPEDVEDEEVERHEDAEHARLEEQDGDVVLALAQADGVPRPEDRERRDDRRQGDQQDGDAIHAEEVRDTERVEPDGMLGELELGGAIELHDEDDGQHEADQRYAERDLAGDGR